MRKLQKSNHALIAKCTLEINYPTAVVRQLCITRNRLIKSRRVRGKICSIATQGKRSLALYRVHYRNEALYIYSINTHGKAKWRRVNSRTTIPTHTCEWKKNDRNRQVHKPAGDARWTRRQASSGLSYHFSTHEGTPCDYARQPRFRALAKMDCAYENHVLPIRIYRRYRSSSYRCCNFGTARYLL